MANKYYNGADKYVFDGDTAVEADPNDINRDVEAAFDIVEVDIVDATVQSEYWAGVAEDWAVKETDVEPGLGSSKTYSEAATTSAAAAAISETNTAQSEANVVIAEQNSANCAAASNTSAGDAAADVVLTNADVVLTHADVVLTNADVLTIESAVEDAVPLAGLTGQSLLKTSDADHDTEWGNPSGTVPTAGLTGQSLLKTSGADYDTEWGNPPGSFKWFVVQGNYTVKDLDGVLVDTSIIPVTITATLNPTIGMQFALSDFAETFETNNCLIARNGQLLMGLAQDLLLNVNNRGLTIVFAGGTTGWKVVDATPYVIDNVVDGGVY
jgi:hypothetical protein